MAERIADDADLAVDELKRKARRRLIGAIVLALAAAVILPLLLEKEPKPLGDDVSVQIPPVDEGRFVNRLTPPPAPAKSATKTDTRPPLTSAAAKTDSTPAPTSSAAPPSTTTPDASNPAVGTNASATASGAPTPDAAAPPASASPSVSPPRKSVSEAEQKVLAGGGRPTPAKTETPTKNEPPPKTETPAKVEPPAKVATAAPAPAPATAAPPPTAVVTSTGEGFAVQIAAFTDDKGANALVGKLKKAGYASTYTEPVETSRGTLWRVRVGSFATRPDADNVRARLKADGWNGIVVATK